MVRGGVLRGEADPLSLDAEAYCGKLVANLPAVVARGSLLVYNRGVLELYSGWMRKMDVSFRTRSATVD
jgi:hypothetical protein